MRRALIVPLAAAALLAACSGTNTPGAPATAQAPAFDTISLDVTQSGGGTVVLYNFDDGSNLWQSKATVAVNQTPLHVEVSKPHGLRDIGVKTMNFPGMTPISCTLRINGAVVAADTGATVDDGVECNFKGTA